MDQRMSATGFEETDLTYQVSESESMGDTKVRVKNKGKLLLFWENLSCQSPKNKVLISMRHELHCKFKQNKKQKQN